MEPRDQTDDLGQTLEDDAEVPDADELIDQELLVDELLVEEISIDGMCGVY